MGFLDRLTPVGLLDSILALWDRLPEPVRHYAYWAFGVAVMAGWGAVIAVNDFIATFGAFGYMLAAALALGTTLWVINQWNAFRAGRIQSSAVPHTTLGHAAARTIVGAAHVNLLVESSIEDVGLDMMRRLLAQAPRLEDYLTTSEMTPAYMVEHRAAAREYVAEAVRALAGTRWGNILKAVIESADKNAHMYFLHATGLKPIDPTDNEKLQKYISAKSKRDSVVFFLKKTINELEDNRRRRMTRLEQQSTRSQVEPMGSQPPLDIGS